MSLTRRRALLALLAPAVSAAALCVSGCPAPSSGGGETPQTGRGDDVPSRAEANPKKLVFGFVPSTEANKIAEDAKPMADFISKEVGLTVETFTSTDYVGLVEAMGSGKVDIGSLPPLAYVLAKDQNAADVLLKTSRQGSLTYHSMFVARAGSGITSVEQAKGKRMAFVDASSASGYLFPAAYLKNKLGADPDTYFSNVTFAGAHDRAVEAVYNGDVDVAAVYDDARNKVEKNGIKDVKQKVVKIGQTDEIPNDTIAVRATLDPALAKKIQAALLKYAASPDGKKTLFDVYEVDALKEAQDSDYDPVRKVAQDMGVQLSMFDKSKKAAVSASPGAVPSPSASPAAMATPGKP